MPKKLTKLSVQKKTQKAGRPTKLLRDKWEFVSKGGPEHVAPEIEIESQGKQSGETADEPQIGCLPFAMNEFLSMMDALGNGEGNVAPTISRTSSGG